MRCKKWGVLYKQLFGFKNCSQLNSTLFNSIQLYSTPFNCSQLYTTQFNSIQQFKICDPWGTKVYVTHGSQKEGQSLSVMSFYLCVCLYSTQFNSIQLYSNLLKSIQLYSTKHNSHLFKLCDPWVTSLSFKFLGSSTSTVAKYLTIHYSAQVDLHKSLFTKYHRRSKMLTLWQSEVDWPKSCLSCLYRQFFGW